MEKFNFYFSAKQEEFLAKKFPANKSKNFVEGKRYTEARKIVDGGEAEPGKWDDYVLVAAGLSFANVTTTRV